MYILSLFGGPTTLHSLVIFLVATTAVVPLAIEYIFEIKH